ncbi:isocitrate lyase/PEP mutase family protein [Lysinibacillus parviboronicapiens]|uniref:isocitrate lyase/PEP mutase family protein n=1 Tax=Lysinibacillus parviboronicapiens TaxID=436516 RepID=UPI0006CFAD09|nr:isocitrate lyase/phosphoenolpyruvate mutase family protein [Lysinibacillus parviboronicapiens]
MTTIQQFNELHASPELLFIGNAWDLLSALTLEKAGFKAIGTTSWGIANSLGYVDGELIDFNRHLAIIKTMADNINIPVSADIEAGYGSDTKTIVENVLRIADVGVAGINIEDSLKNQQGLRTLREHCDILTHLRTALEHRGYKDFYINARTDTYFHEEQPFLETLNRAKAYVESGASGIFIPGMTDHQEIRELTLTVDVPINLMSLPGLTNCTILKELGVKRFSFGNALSDSIIAYLTKHARRLMDTRDTSFLYEE